MLPPVPKVPPVIPRVVDPPLQIGDTELAAVGAIEFTFNTTVVLTQLVVLHVPIASTQYVVVTVGLTTGAAPDVT